MKIKTKLIASIMSICLVCAVFAIGVFALKTANLKIGGDVSFTATGVEAHIKNASVSGAVTPTTLAANDAEGEVINTSMTQADIDTTFANWSDIELDFDENATDIELKFEIANTSTNADNYIEIDYSYSFSNSSPNVDVIPGDENDQSVWENNNYILAPKGATPAAGDYETFTLKFKVLDKELNVPQDTKVNLTIALKHTTPKTATATNNVVTIDNIKYTLNASAGTASVTGHSITESGFEAVIHPIVKDTAENATPCIVTGIADSAFRFDEKIASISFPGSVTDIGGSAFHYCVNLASVDFSNSVTNIGYGAFQNCSNLNELSVPSSVGCIEELAFEETPVCDNLPDGLIYLGRVAYKFKGTMPENTSIVLRNGTTFVAGNSFMGCSGLSSVTMPDSVTSIGTCAFMNCTGLSFVKMPEKMTMIGDYVFTGCTALTSINIPEGVEEIKEHTFKSCTSLKSINISNTVTKIYGYVFAGCTSLNSVSIPSSVNCIYYFAFDGCNNLTSAKFDNPTGWFVADSADATSGTPATVTSDFTEANATVLKGLENGEYLLRKDA